MQHIHCSVNNCHYWSQGNRCSANEIIVVSDAKANSLPDKIDATMAAQFPQTPVDSCMSTCCKSFVLANSNNINADSITRQY